MSWVVVKSRLAGLVGKMNPRFFRREKPEGWLSTRECQALLKVETPRRARDVLRRAKVRAVTVKEGTGQAVKFWERSGVFAVLARRAAAVVLPRVDVVPEGWMRSGEVLEVLGCARSSLCRMVQRGELAERQVRMRWRGEVRRVSLFRRDEVEGVLRARRAAAVAALARLDGAVCVVFANAVMAWALVVASGAGGPAGYVV